MNVRLLVVWLAPLGLSSSACIFDLKPDVGELQIDAGDSSSEDGSGDGMSGDGDGSADGSPGDGSMAGDGGVPGDAAAGDGGMVEEDAATGPVEGCDIEDSNPSVRVSFAADVMPILNACFNCHNSGASDPLGILESGLTIDDYATLRMGGDNSGRDVVIDRNPCDSILPKKLSETPPFGDRMPFEGPYLTLEERTLISDWIVEGAHDN